MIPGLKVAQWLKSGCPAERGTWHMIQGLEIKEGSDQRSWMNPGNGSARHIGIDGGCGK